MAETLPIELEGLFLGINTDLLKKVCSDAARLVRDEALKPAHWSVYGRIPSQGTIEGLILFAIATNLAKAEDMNA